MSLDKILLVRMGINGPLSKGGRLKGHFRVWVYANSLDLYGIGKIVLMTH